ncbi:hypothetical protein NKH77_54245 [Streptomyces sp. M19]
MCDLLEEARAEGDLAPDRARDRRPTLVSAFFGMHTVSDALDGRRRIEERLDDLWLLLLSGLQARPDALGLLGRVRDN